MVAQHPRETIADYAHLGAVYYSDLPSEVAKRFRPYQDDDIFFFIKNDFHPKGEWFQYTLEDKVMHPSGMLLYYCHDGYCPQEELDASQCSAIMHL